MAPASSKSLPAMVTIGTTGSGKTTFCMHVSGDSATFVVRSGFYSDQVTTTVAEVQFLANNRWLLVDGPGLEHSAPHTDPSRADAEHMRGMIEAIKPLTNVKALLLLVNANMIRLTPSHRQALQTYRDLFLGPGVTMEMLSARIFIVFTNHVFATGGAANPREQRLRDELLPKINETLGTGANVNKVYFVQLNPDDPELMAGQMPDEMKEAQRRCTQENLLRMEVVASSMDGISLQHLNADAPIGQQERELQKVGQIRAHYKTNLAAAAHHEGAMWNPYALMKVQPFPPELMDGAVGSDTSKRLLLEQLESDYKAAVANTKESYNRRREEMARKSPIYGGGEDWHIHCLHCGLQYRYKHRSPGEMDNYFIQHKLEECPHWPYKKWQDEPDEAQQRELHLEVIHLPQGKKKAIVHKFGDMVLKVAGTYVQHQLGSLLEMPGDA